MLTRYSIVGASKVVVINDRCLGVTYQFGNVAPNRALAELWNGTAWSLRLPPNNVDASNFLSSVSCGAVGACTAVGQTRDEGGISATLFESGG